MDMNEWSDYFVGPLIGYVTILIVGLVTYPLSSWLLNYGKEKWSLDSVGEIDMAMITISFSLVVIFFLMWLGEHGAFTVDEYQDY